MTIHFYASPDGETWYKVEKAKIKGPRKSQRLTREDITWEISGPGELLPPIDVQGFRYIKGFVT